MRSDQRVGPATVQHTVMGRDNEIINVIGRLLGFATSQRDSHEHAVAYDAAGAQTRFAPQGDRCSACRWFEVRIYGVEHELDDNGTPITRTARYLLVTSGVSIVPGEMIMRRTSWTDSPFEVLELLTQRRGERPFLPAPSARVLAQAAAWDKGIHSAYIDRAVL